MNKTKIRATEQPIAVDIEGLSARLSCGRATARKNKARCENKKRGFFRKEWFSWQLVEKTQKEEN